MATKLVEANAKSAKPIGLVRGLGAYAAAAIVVGTMIGTGIFLKPSEMAAEGKSIAIVFAAWLVGGLLSLFGALSYAELGASIPEAGGEYAYLRRGFGPVWGFLFGWMHSIVGRPASAAAIAAGLLRFWGFLSPAVATPIYTFHLHFPLLARNDPQFVFTWAQPLAVGALILMTSVNYLGVRFGGQVQIALTFLKVSSVLAIIFLGFLLARGNTSHFTPLFPSSLNAATFSGFLAALAAALWAYDGWEDLNLVGSEVSDPQKNIPRALVGGVIFVIVVYIFFNAVCFYALPFGAVASSQHVASDVVASFAGHGAAFWITLAMIISALGTMNSSILSGARVDYAMARDGLFFRVVAKVHPKFRTPGNALIFQCALASIMALSGTFEDLTSLFIFAEWIFYALAVVAMFRLRRIEPDLPRPYLALGYPVLPALFIAGAIALTTSLWLARPLRSSIGLGLILFGLVFYRYWRGKPAEPRSAALS
ncbi:MAG TPA: amino acid permease [Candidatus Acidoferrales bacterium]|jgi:amino acid transporter|nr:amino acid permease [Candidatus Acidoferrales bacterium]